MARLDALYVADLLLEIGRRAQLEGGNPYKAKAYLRAADSLRHLVRPLAEVIAQDQLQSIRALAKPSPAALSLCIRTAPTPGWINPGKNIRAAFWRCLAFRALNHPQSFNFTSYSALTRSKTWKRACRENRLKDVRGLGPALQRKVLESLAIARAGQGRLRPNRAQEALDHSIADLRQYRPELKDLTVAGDLRRGCEVISDLSLVAYSREAKKPTSERLGALALHIAPPDQFAAALLYATGNQDHIARLESLAVGRGLSLTQAGLRKGTRRIAARTEFDYYKALGLQFIPPELREGRDEVELARKNRLPKLVEQVRSQGLLHIHTDASDGVHSLAEVGRGRANAAISTSASPTTRNPRTTRGGLREQEIAALALLQLDALNRRYGKTFRILKGIEFDIRADGSLDYPAEILARFDFIVASVHSQFRMDRVRQTERIVTAVSNPFTTILGHPTGRLLLRRPGYQVDIEPVLEACARHGVAVEINCNPNRLDRPAAPPGTRARLPPERQSRRALDQGAGSRSVGHRGGPQRRRAGQKRFERHAALPAPGPSSQTEDGMPSALNDDGLRIGTSGWTYDGWRGPFYPKKVAKKDWLAWYALQFTTTEINGSFYRTPSLEAVRAWRERTPPGFLFAWKASKFITHWKRLNENCRTRST